MDPQTLLGAVIVVSGMAYLLLLDQSIEAWGSRHLPDDDETEKGDN